EAVARERGAPVRAHRARRRGSRFDRRSGSCRLITLPRLLDPGRTAFPISPPRSRKGCILRRIEARGSSSTQAPGKRVELYHFGAQVLSSILISAMGEAPRVEGAPREHPGQKESK